MKIFSIDLTNFRPYAGHQRLEFATAPDENVTVIYGTNGGGKTTMLNAFTWCLYGGDLSEDVEYRNELINRTVWQFTPPGVRVSASVQVEFEHKGVRYTVERMVSVTKNGDSQPPPRPEVKMLRRFPDGSTEPVHSVDATIEQMLPKRLSRFFFVNGERIEGLVKPEAYHEIQNAIKTLLGLEEMERALVHLPKVSQRLRKLLKADGNNQQRVDELTAQIDVTDRDLESNKVRKEELEADIAHLKQELSRINLRMVQVETAKPLQHQRFRADDKLKRSRDALETAEADRSGAIARYGFLRFIPDIPQKIVAVCEVLRKRGELPAPLKKTFIEDILSVEQCICGTHLSIGSAERARIEEWLHTRSGLAEVEAAWNSLKGAVDTLDDHREQFEATLNKADRHIAELENEIKLALAEREQVSQELKKFPTEDIAKLETKREEIDGRLSHRTQELGAVTNEIERLTKAKDDYAAQIRKLGTHNEAGKRTLRKLTAVEGAQKALTSMLAIMSDGVRQRLDGRLQRFFSKISLRNNVPELSPEFQLKIWSHNGGERQPAIKGTGENMLLSLAFVGALASEAKDTAARSNQMEAGGDYPVVMDAVFGNLDVDYRRAVARLLPVLTPQVIVLTSEAQAGSVVEAELRARVGKQYVITTHTTKKDVEDVTQEIVLNGGAYPYQVIGSDRDGAQITEVKR